MCPITLSGIGLSFKSVSRNLQFPSASPTLTKVMVSSLVCDGITALPVLIESLLRLIVEYFLFNAGNVTLIIAILILLYAFLSFFSH